MATHPSNKDPIAKFALVVGSALLLAAVYVLISSLVSTIDRNSVKGEIDTQTLVANNAAMVESVLKPIGEVTASDGSGTAPGPARSGEEVYTAVCQACHGTGAAGAPKIDDKAAWEPRVAKGFDALMNTAINGKGAMPARGGQNAPDAELKAAIAYMTQKAGFNLDIPSDAPVAPATEEKPADTSSTPENSNATNQADTADANSQEITEATSEEAAPEEITATTAVTADTTAAGTQPPATPSTPEAPATPATETAAPPPATDTTTPTSPTVADGEKIYKATCFACHGLGVAGAPKVGDKTAWEARIAKGDDVLHTSAIKGIQGTTGVMPPKGGNFSLSDDEVKAAVDYMVSQSR